MTSVPLPKEPTHFFERAPWNRCWLSVLFAAFFAAIDYRTGPYILFPVLYVLPVMLMAWNCHWKLAIGLAFALSVARISFQFHWQFPWGEGVTVLNATLQFGVLVLLASLTSRLANATRSLRERVRTLEGILPICSFCKAICDEEGHWQKMESYVSKRSEAQFSHGVCPDCAARHYSKAPGAARPGNPTA